MFNFFTKLFSKPQYTKRRLNSGYPEAFDSYMDKWVLQKLTKLSSEDYAKLPKCDDVNEYRVRKAL
ncbi:hypothetical protein A7985_05490 [Pseudoalteromonas luteoviolacea]|uniref:Uncharacterized protein n=1 Tax=Pseudoalteromonas luteoviolacea TaxID=43657 RepID=A0A1C0TVX1_9GAMM|nr:hypothetical protein [Pseudoalteromonas luteoviolacea]OCQ23394.1 hypothetical protein A7985_05490 [Pseudoalteromonas luteoviolacea]